MDNNSDIARKVKKMALRTVAGEAKEGFFIPYRYADSVPDQVAPYFPLAPFFDEHQPEFTAWLDKADKYFDVLRGLEGTGPERARLDQYWCPRLDAAMAYTMVRELQPERLVEVGSGHSTRFMVRAIADGGFPCAFTSIDPAPRAAIKDLPVTFLATTLQGVDGELFQSLEAGDFLCVDSSHILMPGTDVDIVLNRILPVLPSGVIVFFHDIFLPHAYPQDWHWRGYNEQNAVGGLLRCGYEFLFASHYVVQDMAEQFGETAIARLPILPGAHECGLWLKKR
jgi:hypothetical protein